MPTVKGDLLADSEKLARVSPLAAGYYAWLISARRVDDFGRFRWGAAGWWEETFWRREEEQGTETGGASCPPEDRGRVSLELFLHWFEEYTRAGLVRWYKVDGVFYGEWTNAQGKKPSDRRYHRAPEPPWSDHDHVKVCRQSAERFQTVEGDYDTEWPATRAPHQRPTRAPVAPHKGGNGAPVEPLPSTHLPVTPTDTTAEQGVRPATQEPDPPTPPPPSDPAPAPAAPEAPQAVEVWKGALSQIEERLPRQTFATWFRPTDALSLENGLLRISVPTEQFRQWIPRNYGELLTEVLPADVRTVDLVVLEDPEEPPPELVSHFLRLHLPEDQARARAVEAMPRFVAEFQRLKKEQPSWPDPRLKAIAIRRLL